MILRGDFYYPSSDEICWRVTQAEADLPQWIFAEARKHLGRDPLCVLNGGANVGAYASMYAEYGAAVYAFEPDEDNFACLVRNVYGQRVLCLQAALGDRPGVATMRRNPTNCGAHAISSTINGLVPMLRVDHLGISPDVIHLDVEGYEPFVIEGARQTIREHKPVIALEWRNQWSNYGWSSEQVIEQLRDFGYELTGKRHHEALFTAQR